MAPVSIASVTENDMLKRLRLKFIALNLGSIALVLVAALIAVSVISHGQNESVVYSSLESEAMQASKSYSSEVLSGSNFTGNLIDQWLLNELNESSGFFGHGGRTNNNSDSNSGTGASTGIGLGAENVGSSSGNTSSGNSSSNTGTDDAFGGHTGGRTPMRPDIGGDRDTAYDFAIAVYVQSNSGVVTERADQSTATISDSTLEQALSRLSSVSDGTGALSDLNLYYAKTSNNFGSYYAFADTSAASNWHTLALILLGVGIVAIAIVLIINLFVSRWALKPVAQAWEQQQQFVADASHELKTPLTVILANTNLLMKHPEASIASQSQWIESTQAEAQQMQELVGDMLELARPVELRTQMASEDIDFSDLLEMQLLQFESVAFENNLNFVDEVQPDLVVHGDEKSLTRLVSTLVDNACKYAEAGGTVDVRLVREGNHTRMTVHNTGTPIAAEDLPHVFDRFYRADKARTRDNGSFGLGLAIAHDVAAKHGGSLTVASSAEAGTTFTALLPLV